MKLHSQMSQGSSKIMQKSNGRSLNMCSYRKSETYALFTSTQMNTMMSCSRYTGFRISPRYEAHFRTKAMLIMIRYYLYEGVSQRGDTRKTSF